MKKGSNNNNLIRFPVEKVKKPVQAEPKFEQPIWFKENQKTFYSSALLIVMFVATFANTTIYQSVIGSRTIASVDGRTPQAIGPAGAVHRNLQWERQLGRHLASVSSREMASIGYKPSIEEKLQFGLLEGKYALQFEEGKLSTVALADSHQAQLNPTYVTDRVKFIEDTSSLLPVAFEKVESISRDEQASKVIETYDLVGNEDQSLAEVEFELDRQGRLISMKVEKLAQQ